MLIGDAAAASVNVPLCVVISHVVLNDKTVQKHIQQEFETYLHIFNNGEVSPNTLWDAAKAVV